VSGHQKLNGSLALCDRAARRLNVQIPPRACLTDVHLKPDAVHLQLRMTLFRCDQEDVRRFKDASEPFLAFWQRNQISITVKDIPIIKSQSGLSFKSIHQNCLSKALPFSIERLNNDTIQHCKDSF